MTDSIDMADNGGPGGNVESVQISVSHGYSAGGMLGAGTFNSTSLVHLPERELEGGDEAGSNRHLLREDFFDELSRGYKTSRLTLEHRDELMHARECA